MATPLDRVVGSTTASAYGRGPASGVDYFAAPGQNRGMAMQPPSNVTPGAQDLVIEDEPYDVGVYDGGGGGYGGSEAVQGSPQSAATLGNLGYGLGIAGQVMGEPGLSMAGGTLGAVGAAQQGNIGPAVGMATGLMTGNPALAAAANYGTQMATGTFGMNPTNIGGIVGGLVGGPVGSVVGSNLAGGLFGTNASMSPGGVPSPGYAGLLGTDLGTALGAEAFSNPSTPAGIGTEGGVGFGLGGAAGIGGQVGQAGADMGGAQGVTGSTSGEGLGGMTGGGGLGMSDTSGSFGGGIGSGIGGGYGGDGGFGGTAGSGNDGGDNGAGGGGWANGGMIQPGLTRRFADGGPLLAMGYAQGGSVQMGPTPGSTSVTAQVNRILRDPRLKQEIAARAQALMDSGELTTDEVQIMARVAEAAMYNQQLYPQLRQFVAEQGMTPLPAAYDPATIVKIMAIARVLQEVQPATPPGQVPPVEQAQVSPPPGMKQGGLINGPGTGRSDSIGTINRSSGEPVSVANNEYIIPEHVVRIKGREFFDKLLARYENAPKEQA